MAGFTIWQTKQIQHGVIQIYCNYPKLLQRRIFICSILSIQGLQDWMNAICDIFGLR